MDDDCLSLTFLRLDVKDIVKCILASRHFSDVIVKKKVWYHLCMRDYRDSYGTFVGNNHAFNQIYTFCYLLDRLNKKLQTNLSFVELYYSEILSLIPGRVPKNRPKLNAVPKEVGFLANLRRVALPYNDLTEFPIGICQIRELRMLSLIGNRIEKLPPDIGKLNKLVEINLSNNQLTGLPMEICYLANLRKLYLYANQIKRLPKGITKLKKLERLNVNANSLYELFAEIGQMASLRILEVSGNHLLILPKEISLLNLTFMNISDNPIIEIPKEIKQMANFNDFLIDQ